MSASSGSWPYRARCQGAGTDRFFPTGAGTASRIAYRKVSRTICADCPVAQQCLELAMATEGGAAAGARYGLFGGLSPAQRYELHRKRTEAAQPAA